MAVLKHWGPQRPCPIFLDCRTPREFYNSAGRMMDIEAGAGLDFLYENKDSCYFLHLGNIK